MPYNKTLVLDDFHGRSHWFVECILGASHNLYHVEYSCCYDHCHELGLINRIEGIKMGKTHHMGLRWIGLQIVGQCVMNCEGIM